MSETIIGGRYEIRKELGKGGMGTVHLAFDTRLEREVALKVLDDSFTSGPEASARFEREAKTVAALEHHAIVSMYDYGEDGDFGTYLVMHLMQGGSLQDRIRQGPLDPEEALRITERLAGALDKAHSRGIVHRDLKPANVMFDEEGEAYLGDFGIIKDEAGESFTRTGMPVGTPHYMSPEQAEGRPDIDGRSDIYTLGIVLYEMLAGGRPFVHEHDSFSGLLMMHLKDPVPNILEARPELPGTIQGVIEKAMAKKPEDRFSTAKALSDAAQAAFSSQAAPAGEVAAPAQPATETASAKVETKADVEPKIQPEPAAATVTKTASPAKSAAPAKKGLPKWVYAIIAVVVLGIIGLVILLSLGGDIVEVIIVNETGTEICEVYVEEDNDFDLWEDWLEDPPLLPGEGLPVYVSADVPLYIEVVGCDGSEIRDDFGEIFAVDGELILR